MSYFYRAIDGDIDIVAQSIQTPEMIVAGTSTLPAATTQQISFSNLPDGSCKQKFVTSDNTKTAQIDFTFIGQDYGGKMVYDNSTHALSFYVNANPVASLVVNSTGLVTAENGCLIKKSSATKDYPILSYQENLNVSESTSALIGVKGTLNNSAEITFNYTGGDGSALNSVGLGLFGNANKITITPTSVGSSLPLTIPSVTYSPSIIPFKYSEGNFTPKFQYVKSTGVSDPLATITYSVQLGYYTRIGNQVTVYYNLVFTSLGGDAFIGGLKFFAIGDLPFPCRRAVEPLKMLNETAIVADYPNGFTVMVPAPSAPVFPGQGRTAILYESGTAVPLEAWDVVSISKGTWTADGTTMLVNGPIDVNIPLFDTYKAFGQIYNFWVALDAVTYSFAFSGRMIYYTDAPY